MSERWRPHVTVAGVVARDGRYLLVEEHTRAGLRLNNPAGHLEPRETPLQAVAREFLEETGWTFEPQWLLGVYLVRVPDASAEPDRTYVRLAFGGALGPHDAARPLDTGIVRTIWMDLPELRATQARHRNPLVLRCVEDHAAGVRYPLSVIGTDPSVLAAAAGDGR